MVTREFIITNNHVSFHLWGKENLLNHQKVSKYYEHDCGILQGNVDEASEDSIKSTIFARFRLIMSTFYDTSLKQNYAFK